MKFIKINKKVVEVNNSEAFIYMVIARSNYKKMKISRAYLASCLGVNNLDYITEIITSLVNNGLVERWNVTLTDDNGQKTTELKLTALEGESWFKLGLDVADSKKDSKMLGFALRYRCLAFDDTLTVKYTKQEISDILEISRPTLNKYLISINTMQLNPTDLCNVIINKLTDNNKKALNDMITLFKPTTKEHRLGKWFIDKRLYAQSNANELFCRLQAGLLNKKTIKEIKQLSYEL